MYNINRLLSILIIFSLTSGCSSFFEGKTLPKSKTYKLSFSHPDWVSIDPDSSDQAFKNKKTGSIIIMNSQCEKYNDTSLETESRNIFSGVSELNVEKNEKITFSNREALLTESSASMDGVRVYLKSLVFHKDRCLYDVILISHSKASRESDSKTFLDFVQGLAL